MPKHDQSGNETRRQTLNVSEAVPSVEVVVVQGRDLGLRARLEPGADRLVIGTAPGSDLLLRDPLVSRRHASIEWTLGGVLVTDAGLTNGTYVNDVRVEMAYVIADARLTVGGTVIQAITSEGTTAKRRRAGSFGRMASSSPRMINVLSLAERVAPTDIPVVVEGETGTGKEFLAEGIHEASLRSKQPFVVLDCRTTPSELALPYLFGAVLPDGTVRPGVIELANPGTLFVDEPGDLPLDVQAQLLRALDSGEFTRVGDTQAVKVDVRLVVASSRNLDKLVEEGKFREDLYFRLAGTRIEIPPLRRRREDIPLLGAELWSELGGEGALPDEFLDRFAGYEWPGNIRELERAIERFLALGDKVSLAVSRVHRHVAHPDLPKTDDAMGKEGAIAKVLGANLAYSDARRRVLEEFRRAYLEKALVESGGNVGRAAARSGIARRHFQRIRAK